MIIVIIWQNSEDLNQAIIGLCQVGKTITILNSGKDLG